MNGAMGGPGVGEGSVYLPIPDQVALIGQMIRMRIAVLDAVAASGQALTRQLRAVLAP